ncbi:hypothetical protein [Pseudomonas sp. TNT2022 ID642]|uniref:hypothetical protein n=1 Tax=Pseudomonas sp. TNT2022 ID642 TaxID=2942632 RepID=UPI00235EE82B|nr:hypothetical protein [Pseudomonas sp. TNT2022 ID642]MDD1002444.1 hypothetical protein [Pseudomonas sp. TNT2022 ID642]
MAVTDQDFMLYATLELERGVDDEILLRNVGSRAYYSAFHRARRLLREKNLAVVQAQDAGSHKSITDTIATISPKAKAVAVILNKLKRYRCNCDYDLGMQIGRPETQKHLAEVIRIVGVMDRI